MSERDLIADAVNRVTGAVIAKFLSDDRPEVQQAATDYQQQMVEANAQNAEMFQAVDDLIKSVDGLGEPMDFIADKLQTLHDAMKTWSKMEEKHRTMENLMMEWRTREDIEDRKDRDTNSHDEDDDQEEYDEGSEDEITPPREDRPRRQM